MTRWKPQILFNNPLLKEYLWEKKKNHQITRVSFSYANSPAGWHDIMDVEHENELSDKWITGQQSARVPRGQTLFGLKAGRAQSSS